MIKVDEVNMNIGAKGYDLMFFRDEDINANKELKDVLHLIGDVYISKLFWVLDGVEWYGYGIADFVKEEEAADYQIVISGQRFLDLAEGVYNTIDGYFEAYLTEKEANKWLGTSWGDYADSPVEMAIIVRQGYVFDVFVRSKELADKIAQSFENVEWLDDTLIDTNAQASDSYVSK